MPDLDPWSPWPSPSLASRSLGELAAARGDRDLATESPETRTAAAALAHAAADPAAAEEACLAMTTQAKSDGCTITKATHELADDELTDEELASCYSTGSYDVDVDLDIADAYLAQQSEDTHAHHAHETREVWPTQYSTNAEQQVRSEADAHTTPDVASDDEAKKAAVISGTGPTDNDNGNADLVGYQPFKPHVVHLMVKRASL